MTTLMRPLTERLEIARYTCPNPFLSPPALDDGQTTTLQTLRTNGVVALSPRPELARSLHDLFERLESSAPAAWPRGVWDKNLPLYRSYGASLLCEISFRWPGVEKLVLSPEVAALCAHYYGRQPYYRNQPVLQTLEPTAPDEALPGNAFHVDRLRQLSLMLLVSDVSGNDTHMQYVSGSQRRSLWRSGIGLSAADASRIAGQGPCFRLLGPAGSLFLFDASGVHRRALVPGSRRRILHLNITTGHHVEKTKDTLADWASLRGSPPLVRKMFSP